MAGMDYVRAWQFTKHLGDEDKWHEEIEGTLADHDQQLDELHKILFGNGDNSIGWDETIRKIRKFFDDLEKNQASTAKANADAENMTKLEQIKGSWQYRIAVVGGIIMLVQAVVTAIISALVAVWVGG
jgi:hypothetical protein